ncbi:uncharacterized protein LOC110990795 [Acanthaster planci]|uniref:Uncharacterized protein LOC110990795 n=1 Tax=Acanthaster planci TaxID=133434 RepID=A0A8B8A1N1_ACAPL|nr:uncharacterized protein LOC110990795 [Acanthaster planci]
MDIFAVILAVVVVLASAYVAANLASPDRVPLHDVYAVPGRWYLLKYVTAKWLLWWSRERKCTIKKRTMNYHMMQDKTKDNGEMEFYNGTEKGQNCLYISGASNGGTARLTVRVSVQPDDRRDVWFLLRLPDVGDLVLPGHPDCVAENVRPGEGFSGAGLCCTPIEPLQIWRILFNGLCR